MKPRQNRRVRAQRKFAQNAVIPAGASSASVQDRRPEHADRPLEPIVQIARLPACSLLDHVAFKNVHNHYPGLREIRVVLDRLPAEETSTASSSTHAQETFSVPTGRAPPHRKIKPKQTVQREVEVTKKSRLSLRSRSISRDCSKTLKSKNIKRVISQTKRPLNWSAIDDNRPLRYYLNKKNQAEKKKNSQAKNKNKRQQKSNINKTDTETSNKSSQLTSNMPSQSTNMSSQSSNTSILDKTTNAKKVSFEPRRSNSLPILISNVTSLVLNDARSEVKKESADKIEETIPEQLNLREPSLDLPDLNLPNSDEIGDTSHWPVKVEQIEDISISSPSLRETSKAVDEDSISQLSCTSMILPSPPHILTPTSIVDVYEFNDESATLTPQPYRPNRNDCPNENTEGNTGHSGTDSMVFAPNNLTEMETSTPMRSQCVACSGDLPECENTLAELAPKRPKVMKPQKTTVKRKVAKKTAASGQKASHTNMEPSTSASFHGTRSTASSSRSNLDTVSTTQGSVREGRRFTPTSSEAENPIHYATHIKFLNPEMGICTIKLPDSFKPPLITDDDRPVFKMSSQYVNKLYQRWSPATRELLMIKCIQKQKMKTSPLFEGVELDLVNLYKYVQEHDGLKNVLSKDKWTEIINKLRISSKGQPSKKLEKLYFKYLLLYETMTYLEREDIHHKVSKCWEELHKKHMERALRPLWRQERMMNLEPYNDDSPTDLISQACMEAEDCVAHNNRTCTLKQFRKIADRVKAVYLAGKPSATVAEVEQEYWRVVMLGTEHVSVNVSSVDTTEYGHGFPADEDAPYGSHPWNLKRVCRSGDNVLSYLDPTVGISAPSLQYGMAFTTSCWHMDPHMLPWIEYLHEGPPKIWYSVPESQSSNFRAAVSALCPTAVQNKSIWLPADITMIPPSLLQQHNVTLDRVVQHPGEFVVVYPNTYSASIDTGMTLSEGTYYAPHSWLQNIEHIFKELRENCEPSMFPMEQLLIGLARNELSPPHVLTHTHTVLQPLLTAELRHRAAAVQFGLRILTPQQEAAEGKKSRYTQTNECFYCRCTIYLSRVVGLTESGTSMCLEHGLRLYDKSKKKNVDVKGSYCLLHYSNQELEDVITLLQSRISSMATGWALNTQ